MNKVEKYLDKFNMKERIINLEASSATVKLAAEALGCEEARIAKSLSFLLNDRSILIVTAGDVKIDNSKYKQTFHEKAHMIPFNDVEKIIGHPVGGVCPFSINENVDIYLDESLKRFNTVFPACGKPNNAIELSIDELEKVVNYKDWIDVCKQIEKS